MESNSRYELKPSETIRFNKEFDTGSCSVAENRLEGNLALSNRCLLVEADSLKISFDDQGFYWLRIQENLNIDVNLYEKSNYEISEKENGNELVYIFNEKDYNYINQ